MNEVTLVRRSRAFCTGSATRRTTQVVQRFVTKVYADFERAVLGLTCPTEAESNDRAALSDGQVRLDLAAWRTAQLSGASGTYSISGLGVRWLELSSLMDATVSGGAALLGS